MKLMLNSDDFVNAIKYWRNRRCGYKYELFQNLYKFITNLNIIFLKVINHRLYYYKFFLTTILFYFFEWFFSYSF